MNERIIPLLLIGAWLGCDRAPSPPPEPPPLAPAPIKTELKTAEPTTPAAAPLPAEGQAPPELLALVEKESFVEARELLAPIVSQPDAPSWAVAWLGEVNRRILFTPVPAPEKIDYTIEAGDTLGKIAKEFGTTIELLKASNSLKRDLIRAGDRLRIYRAQFAVTVNISSNSLTVHDAGRFFLRYPVGTGRYDQTPLGEFQITTRVEHPPWWRPDGQTIPYGDPENILGTHWLGLDVPGYGLHGTWDTNSIGQQATAGCVRLRNEDVAELYVMLPVGTPVTIRR